MVYFAQESVSIVDFKNYSNESRHKKIEKPKVKNKISLTLYVIFWALILIMFSGLIITQAGQYNELRTTLNRINEDVARERAIHDDLNHQLQFFDSDAYIESLARERLGMIRPNEIVFRNVAE